MNNDLLSLVRRFGNDFHSWLRHSWKSLPNRLTRDKKSLFTVTHALFFISDYQRQLQFTKIVNLNVLSFTRYVIHNIMNNFTSKNEKFVTAQNMLVFSTQMCLMRITPFVHSSVTVLYGYLIDEPPWFRGWRIVEPVFCAKQFWQQQHVRIGPWTKSPITCRHFSMHFLEWKLLDF